LFKKRAQTAGTGDTQFCFAERPGKRLAAQGRFLIGSMPFGARFRFSHRNDMKAFRFADEKPILD
jgi:hypothetical protein